jgi:hypothetical protein
METSWEEAASGLDTYKNAILFRIVVTLASVLYMVMQFMSKKAPEPGGFALVLAGAELLSTLMAITGVARFASKAPGNSAGPAGVATVCLIGVACVEVWTLWITIRVIQAISNPMGTHDIWDLAKSADHLPYIAIGAGIAGMLALLCVLGGIRAVGRELGNEEINGRARGMMMAVVILALAYGLIQRWALSGRVGDSALGVLAMLAVFGLVVLFAYISLLNNTAAAMRRGIETTLPTATAVKTD